MTWFPMARTTPKVVKAMTWISSAGKTLRGNSSLRFRESGFTLIEMISVLVMIGLFMALVTPFVMTTLDRIQEDSSAHKLVSMLASVRSKAVATKTSLVFQGDLDQNQYWVNDPETEKNSEIMELDRTIQFREFNDGEESWDHGIFSVTFYPLGSTSGGTILLKPQDTDTDAPSFLLTIDPVTGKPYLQRAS
jgi:prepilin-type N-terminal cleavage/methylation domain-containing protein